MPVWALTKPKSMFAVCVVRESVAAVVFRNELVIAPESASDRFVA